MSVALSERIAGEVSFTVLTGPTAPPLEPGVLPATEPDQLPVPDRERPGKSPLPLEPSPFRKPDHIQPGQEPAPKG